MHIVSTGLAQCFLDHFVFCSFYSEMALKLKQSSQQVQSQASNHIMELMLILKREIFIVNCTLSDTPLEMCLLSVKHSLLT